MTAKVGLQRLKTRAGSGECILQHPCQFPVVFLREFENISSKLKENGKLGHTLCPIFAMLYLVKNMCYFIRQVIDT
jgi:hypothetical protein